MEHPTAVDDLADAEGDIRHNLDRGWRIDRWRDGWWWLPPFPHALVVPPMALTDTETAVWETLRTGPPALRPKETR